MFIAVHTKSIGRFLLRLLPPEPLLYLRYLLVGLSKKTASMLNIQQKYSPKEKYNQAKETKTTNRVRLNSNWKLQKKNTYKENCIPQQKDYTTKIQTECSTKQNLRKTDKNCYFLTQRKRMTMFWFFFSMIMKREKRRKEKKY